jgi:hypothetical protein
MRSLLSTLMAVAATALVAGCGGQSVLIASRSAEMVQRFVYDHFGIHVRATCPSGVPAVAGQKYNCYFEAPDGRYVAHIKVLSVHGAATQNRIETQGPLS